MRWAEWLEWWLEGISGCILDLPCQRLCWRLQRMDLRGERNKKKWNVKSDIKFKAVNLNIEIKGKFRNSNRSDYLLYRMFEYKFIIYITIIPVRVAFRVRWAFWVVGLHVSCRAVRVTVGGALLSPSIPSSPTPRAL